MNLFTHIHGGWKSQFEIHILMEKEKLVGPAVKYSNDEQQGKQLI